MIAPSDDPVPSATAALGDRSLGPIELIVAAALAIIGMALLATRLRRRPA